MRTFIALELSEGTREALSRVAEGLKPGLGRVTWVKPDRMHLTLKFLGEIDQESAGPICERLEEVCLTAAPFSLAVVGIGCFPNPRRPRVIWAGLEGDVEPARHLQREIDTALSPLGFEREQRPFSPHITLGRVRGAIKQGLLSEAIEAGSGRRFGEETIDEVTFMRSRLEPGGPIYTPIARFRLGQAVSGDL